MKCYLLVDASTSMGYSYAADTMTKMDYSISCAAALSYLMCHQQDPVGLITFDTRSGTSSRRGAASQLFNVLSVLARTPVGGNDRRRGEPDRDLEPDQEAEPGPSSPTCSPIRDRCSRSPVPPLQGPRRHRLPRPRLRRSCAVPLQGCHALRGHRDGAAPAGGRRPPPQGLPPQSSGLHGLRQEGCHQARIDYAPMDTSIGFDRTLVTFLAKRANLK
jgi:hypothetical protein